MTKDKKKYTHRNKVENNPVKNLARAARCLSLLLTLMFVLSQRFRECEQRPPPAEAIRIRWEFQSAVPYLHLSRVVKLFFLFTQFLERPSTLVSMTFIQSQTIGARKALLAACWQEVTPAP